MTKQITPVSCHNYRDAKNEINSAFPQIQRPETDPQIKKNNVKRKEENDIHKMPHRNAMAHTMYLCICSKNNNRIWLDLMTLMTHCLLYV